MRQKVQISIGVSILILACGFLDTPTSIPVIQEPTLPLEENANQPEANNKGNTTSAEEIIISRDTLDDIPPDDVIREIAYFGGLGGGCGKELCECEFYEHPAPSLFSNTDNFGYTEFLNDIVFEICGLQENEAVNITITPPNESSESHVITSYPSQGDYPGFMIDFEYTPVLPYSPGTYHFNFSGSNWNFDKYIEVLDASEPRLLLDYEGRLTFYNFQPNENVRLLAYQNGVLIGWKQLLIGANGTLQIQTTLEADYIALGERSGEVFDKEQGDNPPDWAWLGTPTNIHCNGAVNPTGIKAGGNVEVLTDSLPEYKYNWDDYSVHQSGMLDIKKGSIVQVMSNAICYNGTFLWKICVNEDCEHYVPEATSQVTYLRPTTQSIESLPVPALQSSIIPACPGTLPTRLFIGANAEVTTSGMAQQLSLRAQPSMDAEKIHVIAAGRDMVILDGPACADNSYWWYIRSEQGFEGWSREGDNEDYWIDPLP